MDGGVNMDDFSLHWIILKPLVALIWNFRLINFNIGHILHLNFRILVQVEPALIGL